MTPVRGASAQLEREIRLTLSRLPGWLSKPARLGEIVVSDAPEVAAQIAMYEHGSRRLSVWSKIPKSIMSKALAHELAHAIDDNFGNGHFFTSTPEWVEIHRNQAYFDLPKYRDQPLEYFADMVAKLVMLGPQRLSTTNPDEVRFITSWVIPTLQQSFGQ